MGLDLEGTGKMGRNVKLDKEEFIEMGTSPATQNLTSLKESQKMVLTYC